MLVPFLYVHVQAKKVAVFLVKQPVLLKPQQNESFISVIGNGIPMTC